MSGEVILSPLKIKILQILKILGFLPLAWLLAQEYQGYQKYETDCSVLF